jgi:hypothetical protein
MMPAMPDDLHSMETSANDLPPRVPPRKPPGRPVPPGPDIPPPVPAEPSEPPEAPVPLPRTPPPRPPKPPEPRMKKPTRGSRTRSITANQQRKLLRRPLRPQRITKR